MYIVCKPVIKISRATLKKSIELVSEKGSLVRLSVLPLQEHNFCLHKNALHMHDAPALKYGWNPARLTLHCACGKNSLWITC